MSPSREEAMALLGYPPQWQEKGLLSPELLQTQLERFQSGEDTSTEHHRYAAFLALLPEGPLSDERVKQYLVLVGADPDRAMARAALYELVALPQLTEAQFARLEAHPLCTELEAPVRRYRMLRALHREGPTVALLEEALAAADRAVQTELVERTELPAVLLERLSQDGMSKRIRNIAAARLRQRKPRQRG